MPANDRMRHALRADYNRQILTDVVYIIIFLYMLIPLPQIVMSLAWSIPVCVGIASSVTCYAWERRRLRKGKNPKGVFLLFCLLPVALLAILLQCGVFPDTNAVSCIFYIPAFFLGRTVIPLTLLLRDGIHWRKGKLCESVGYRKGNVRRMDNSMTREYYVLFQEELTHKTHLIRMANLSPGHRYRLLFLPHSGIAAGEIIPRHHKKNPVSTEICADEPLPARRKANQYGKAGSICETLALMPGIGGFCCAVLLRFPIALCGGFIFMIVLLLVGGYMRQKNRELRCTHSTTAHCLETIERGGGRRHVARPIVEYEVNGVTYVNELPIRCTYFDVGKAFTIYYDPLDPNTVRPE